MKEKLTSLFTSQTFIRVAVTTALIAYPLACLAMLLLPKDFVVVGGSLFGLSALATICSLPSYLSRIAFVPKVLRFVDDTARLDDMELELRRRSQAFSYQIFTILTLGVIMYFVIASDMTNAGEGNLWLPRVDDHWLAILFGAFLYTILLPLAYLAWKLPKPVADESPAVPDDSEFHNHFMIIGMLSGMTLGLLFFDGIGNGMMIGMAAGSVADLISWKLKKKSK